MKKKKYNKNSIVRRPEGTASSLIETILNEVGWDYREWQGGLSYHFNLKFEDGNVADLFADAYDEYSSVRLMDFNWCGVDISDVEEVARVKSEINQFNDKSRAKVYYRVEGDVMMLSTILNCNFCKGIPDIKEYFFYQMNAVLEARKFIFPKDDRLSWHDITVDPKGNLNVDIVLDALKEMNCKPNVEREADDLYFVPFEYQTVPFTIEIVPTSKFVLLHGPFWYDCDAEDVDEFRKVTSVVNELNWTFNANVIYEMVEGRCYVTCSAFLTCYKGLDFTLFLHLMIVNYFCTKKAFFEMLVES